MPRHGTIRVVRVRLIDTGVFPAPSTEGSGRGLLYRPLAIGPAILWRLPGRAGARAPWQVDVLDDRGLEPATPRRALDVERIVAWRRAEGQRCRIALALVCGDDIVAPGVAAASMAPRFPGRSGHGRGRFRHGAAIEIYGWSLLYRHPGVAGRALVDPHDTIPDLPAWYESPLELADRATFLAARGIRSRPVALVTRPEDFVAGDDGPVNRFFPSGDYRVPADLRRLV